MPSVYALIRPPGWKHTGEIDDGFEDSFTMLGAEILLCTIVQANLAHLWGDKADKYFL